MKMKPGKTLVGIGTALAVLAGLLLLRSAIIARRMAPGDAANPPRKALEAPKTPSLLVPRPESRTDAGGAVSRPTAAREIQVVSAWDGAPLARSSLSIGGVEEGTMLRTTGPGFWMLEAPLGRSVLVYATAPDHVPSERRIMLDGTPEAAVVVMARLADLHFIVQEQGTGKVLGDASLEVTGALPGLLSLVLWSGRTNAQGSAVCPASALNHLCETVGLQVSAPGHVSVVRRLRLPLVREVIWLEPGRAVEVCVRDRQGRPIVGASVRSATGKELNSEQPWQPPVLTNARGIAPVAVSVREGTMATVSAAGYDGATVQIPADEDRIFVDLSPARPAGVVLKSPVGARLARVRLTYVPWFGDYGAGLNLSDASESTTDDQGVALLAPIVAESNYLLVFAESPTTSRFYRILSSVDLQGMATVVAPIPRSLRVNVRSTNGAPIDEARVTFVPAQTVALGDRLGSLAPSSSAVMSGPDGGAALLVPEAASGHVIAVKGGFAPAAVAVGDSQEVNITLDPGVPLEVEVLDQNDGAYRGATVVLEPPVMAAATPVRVPPEWRKPCEQRAITGPDGKCTILALSTQSLLRAECPDDVRSERELTAEEIIRQKAVIRVTRRDDVAMRVVDSIGLPIAGAAVVPRVPGMGAPPRVLRTSDENGAINLPIPLPVSGDRRVITFMCGGAAQGEFTCRLVDVRPGMAIKVARAQSRSVLVTVTEATGSPDPGLKAVRYSVGKKDCQACTRSSGVLRVGVESTIEVPTDGVAYVVRLSWDTGPAVAVPIPSGSMRLELALPRRFRIPVTNSTDGPVEFEVTDLGRGELWTAPMLSSGANKMMDLSDDLRHYAIDVRGLAADARTRASFRASETSMIVIDQSGVQVR